MNLWNLKESKTWKELVDARLKFAAIRGRRIGGTRRCCDGPVELADARSLRLAGDRLLAGAGLLVLSKLLLGGLRGGPGRHRHWRGRMIDRWENMTDEEREKFREGMRQRCGRSSSTEQPTP